MKKTSTLVAVLGLALASTATAAAEIVTTVPADAVVQEYNYAGWLFTTFWGSDFPVEESMLPSQIAYDGNTVYWLNPIVNQTYGSYIVGEKEGSTITFKFPQQASSGLYYNRMVNTSLIEGKFDYAVDTEAPNELKFNVDEVGVISWTETDDKSVILGYSTASGAWSKDGAYAIELTPFNNKMTELPAGIELSDYILNYTGEASGYTRTIKCGFDGNDFYAQGLCAMLPDAWAKGTIVDGILKMESEQYMGVDPRLGYRLMLWGIYENVLLPSFNLIYDSEKGTFTAENTLLFCPGERYKGMLSFERMEGLTITPIKEIEDFTPAAPIITDVVVYPNFPNQGWDYIDVTLSTVNVEGQMLDTKNIYYRVFLDGEPYILDPDDFEDLDEPMEWIPYDFTCYDLENTGGSGRSISIYSSDHDAYSIQEKYVDGDKEYLSAISTWSLSGVEEIASDKGSVAQEFYTDLAGRRIETPERGLYIKTTVYTSGRTETAKVVLR